MNMLMTTMSSRAILSLVLIATAFAAPIHAQEPKSISVQMHGGVLPKSSLKLWPGSYPPRLGAGTTLGADVVVGRWGRFSWIGGFEISDRVTKPEGPFKDTVISSKDLEIGAKIHALRTGVVFYPPYSRGIEIIVAPTFLRLDLDNIGLNSNPRIDEPTWHKALALAGNMSLKVTDRIALTASGQGTYAMWDAKELQARCDTIRVRFNWCNNEADGTALLAFRLGVQYGLRGAFPWTHKDPPRRTSVVAKPGHANLNDGDRTEMKSALAIVARAQSVLFDRKRNYAGTMETLDLSGQEVPEGIEIELVFADPTGWGARASMTQKSKQTCVIWGGDAKNAGRVKTALEKSWPARADIAVCDGEPLRR